VKVTAKIRCAGEKGKRFVRFSLEAAQNICYFNAYIAVANFEIIHGRAHQVLKWRQPVYLLHDFNLKMFSLRKSL
jgi:hypothetical protein